jgi:hypothetical protein
MLHNNGIFHLDYSPGNTLITNSNGQYQFWVVDLNRMVFGEVAFEKGLSNFCQLRIDHSTLELIGREYAILRGENPTKAVKIIVDYDRKRAAKLKKQDRMKDILKWVFRSGRDEI